MEGIVDDSPGGQEEEINLDKLIAEIERVVVTHPNLQDGEIYTEDKSNGMHVLAKTKGGKFEFLPIGILAPEGWYPDARTYATSAGIDTRNW